MPLILPGNVGSATAATGFDVANSCRFDRASSSAMSKSSLSGGSNTIGTVSVWLKRSGIGTDQRYWANYAGSDSDRLQFGWQAADKLYIQHGANVQFITTRVFRDVSAWYHVVVAIDSTEADNANRVKVYVNGVRETAFDTFNTLTEDGEIFMNNDKIIIGERQTSDLFYDGYLCEVVQLDGTAAAADSFGEFDDDSGIWKPIDVSGLTFGTNGFYLDFEASGNMGNDANGGTDFTESNIAAVDQSTDTCTNNFATLNILDPVQSDATYSEGNLKWATTTDGHFFWGRSTIGVSTGKWYAEFKATSIAEHSYVGIVNNGPEDNTTVIAGGGGAATTTGAYEWAYKTSDGQIYNTDGGSSYGNTYGDGAIIGLLLNLDDNEISFSKDGTVQNSGTAVSITAAASTPHGFYFFAVADGTSGTSATFEANFGSPPYAISSGNADANGHGNFEYAVPSGYLALCTKNLAESG